MLKKMFFVILIAGLPFTVGAQEFTAPQQIALLDVAGESQDLTISLKGELGVLRVARQHHE